MSRINLGKLVNILKRNLWCLITSVLFVTTFISLGYLSQPPNITDLKQASLFEINPIDLFIYNLLAFTLYLLVTLFFPPFGITLVLKFLFSIGANTKQVARLYQISVYKVVSSGLFHGFGELMVVIAILSLGVKLSLYWITYFFKEDVIEPTEFYRSKVYYYLTIYILGSIVLLISAFFEVYVSNPLFLKLIER